MIKKSVLLSFVVAVIYFSFVFGFGIAAVSYYRNQFAQNIEENFSKMNTLEANQLSSRLEADYEIFKQYLSEKTNAELNLNKPYIYNQSYLGFGTILEDGFLFRENVKMTFVLNLDKTYYTQNISIYNLSQIFQNETSKEVYFFFIHEDRFGYFSAKDYLRSIITYDDFFLANSNGLILFNGIGYNQATNLNGFYNDSTQIVRDLKDNDEGTRIDRVRDTDYMTSYSRVQAINDLYLLEHLDYQLFLGRVDTLVNPIHAIVIIFSVAVVILSLFAAGAFTSIYRDVELSFHQLSYNVIPIVIINKKGRILFRNRQFKREFYDFLGSKYLNQIFMVDMLDVFKLVELKVWLTTSTGPYNSARLNVIKTSMRNYTVLIYPVLAGSTQEATDLVNTHTGIPNLTQYKIDFEEMVKSNKPTLKNQALVCMRIINLRNVELMRGPAYVEEAIYKAANRLRALSARLGEVRFYHAFDNTFVLLYEEEDLLAVKEDVRRIIRTFEEDKIAPVYDINFYLKAGIYEFNRRSERSGAIHVYEKAKLANEQMSQAVDSVIGIYDSSVDRKLQLSFLIAHDLENAISKKELYMAIQPIYDQEKKRIYGFEALLRWNNPKYSGVSPLVLVEVANQSNFLLRLGNYILEESLLIAKELEKYKLTLAINLDPLQILQVGFVDIVKKQILKYEINPKNIVFELTETNLITFFDDIVQKIKELRNFGIQVHIDDFGTGNSSLLYLKELPVDGIKIDREFIKDLENDRYLKAIVSMVVGLAKNLEIDVVAEGVETLYQFDFLEKRGVRFLQGFYIGRPQPLTEALEHLEKLKEKIAKGGGI